MAPVEILSKLAGSREFWKGAGKEYAKRPEGKRGWVHLPPERGKNQSLSAET